MTTSPLRAATRPQIDQAISKGVQFIYSKMNEDNWELKPDYHPVPGKPPELTLSEASWSGLSALAVHALLEAGEKPSDPRMQRAIAFLIKNPIRQDPYTVCQRDQALQLLPMSKEIREVITLDGKFLQKTKTKGDSLGFYAETTDYDAPTYDHSVSQFGVLGMWACAQKGFEPPSGYWQLEERVWARHQHPDGGWSYDNDGNTACANSKVSLISLTAAGVATLFITQDIVHSFDAYGTREGPEKAAIRRGVDYLVAHFDDAAKPSVLAGGSDSQTYSFYCLERVAVAGGYRYFGTHDLFAEGSDFLLQCQQPNGSFAGNFWSKDPTSVSPTAFALFFLCRAREPMVVVKARYDLQQKDKTVEGPWNTHPRDIAKMVRWMEKKTERNFNWHIADIGQLRLEQFSDAPILYLSGNRKLDLPPEQIEKLRAFAEQGGLLFFNPENPGGRSSEFIESVKLLATQLFPKYHFRKLPRTHVIFTRQQFRGTEIKLEPELLAVSNGVRELMIMPLGDYGRSWQTDNYVNSDPFRVMDDIVLYAAGKSIFHRAVIAGDTPSDAAPSNEHLGQIKLARLSYDGNWDPEPAGWTRIQSDLRQSGTADLVIDEVPLGKKKLAGYKIAHLTGTDLLTLTQAQDQELTDFVRGGGVLLIDAAGGNKAFCDAVEAALLRDFPNDSASISTPIAPTDPLLTGGRAKYEFRDYCLFTEPVKYATPKSQLRGIKINGKWGVLWSREDLSNGFLGRETDGVLGYTPASARAILLNALREAAGR